MHHVHFCIVVVSFCKAFSLNQERPSEHLETAMPHVSATRKLSASKRKTALWLHTSRNQPSPADLEEIIISNSF